MSAVTTMLACPSTVRGLPSEPVEALGTCSPARLSGSSGGRETSVGRCHVAGPGLRTGGIPRACDRPFETRTDRLGKLGACLAQLVAQRRESPTGDLIGALVQAYDDQDSLSEEELIGFLMTLLAAGYETTASQIAKSSETTITTATRMATAGRCT